MRRYDWAKAVTAFGLVSCLPQAAWAQLSTSIPTPSGSSASQMVCSALNTLKNTYGSAVPTCSVGSTTETYYNGSMTTANSLADLLIMPYVTNGAYYCAIADSTNAAANATGSALGKFGVESKVRVSRDPATMTLKGERLGTIWLLGAGLTVEAQNFTWKFPAETTTSPAQWGGYMEIKSEGINAVDWDPPNISIPVPVPVGVASANIDFMLFLRNPYERLGNNRLSAPASNDFSYNKWLNCPAQCANTPHGFFCSCDMGLDEAHSKFVADHQRGCAGNCSSLSDGVLPYAGAYGGASGVNADYMYADPMTNWFSLGRARPRTLTTWLRTDVPNAQFRTQVPFDIDTNASTSTLKTQANAGGQLKVGASYDTGLVKSNVSLITTFAFRDGFSVQQQRETLVFDLGTPQVDQVRVWTDMDAESAIDVDLVATIDLNLPLFDPPPITITANDLVKKEWANHPAQLPAELIYDAAIDHSGHTALTSYKVNGVAKSSPDQQRFACLQSAATTFTPGNVTSADDFVKKVAKNSVTGVHPCDFTFCQGGKTYTHKWNLAKNNFDPATSVIGCKVCDDILALCDGSNQPIMQDVPFFNGTISVPVQTVLDSNLDENPPSQCIIR